MNQFVILRFLRSILLGCVISALFLLLLAFLQFQFQLSDKLCQTGIYGIYGISCLFSGFLNGRLMKQRRFLWGILSGLLYFLLLFLLSLCIRSQTPALNSQFLLIAGVCAACGFLGSIL